MCRLTPSLIIFKLCLWSSGTTLVKWMMRNKQTEIFTRMIKRKLPGGGNDSFYDIKFLSCKNWDGREVDFGSDWAIPRNRTHPYSKNGISIWVMLFPFIFFLFFSHFYTCLQTLSCQRCDIDFIQSEHAALYSDFSGFSPPLQGLTFSPQKTFSFFCFFCF